MFITSNNLANLIFIEYKLKLIISCNLPLLDLICSYFNYLIFININVDKQVDEAIYDNYIISNNNKFNNITFDDYKKLSKLYQTNFNILNNHTYDILNLIKHYKLYKKNIIQLSTVKTEEPIIKLLVDNLLIYNINYETDKIINLYSGIGSIMDYIIRNKNSTNIYGYDPDDKLNYINAKNLQIITGINYDNKINTKNILIDDLQIQNANLIICDIPDNIKNIIHAKCSNNIKQLKIRGTKSEPLIIQLITTLLAKNGVAGIIVADSFLYNESIQHIETRKYLITKFTINKIINLENIKKFILIFKNTSSTDSIILYNVNIDKIINLDISNININNYSLYFHHYEIQQNNIENKSNILSVYIDIKPFTNNLESTIETLYIVKYNQLSIAKSSNMNTYDYVFLTKNEDIIRQEFLNYYIKQLLEIHINNLVKGKIRQYDIELINLLVLNIPSLEIQDQIIMHIKYSKQQLINYQHMINNIILLKKKYIESIIIDKPTVQLKNIVDVQYKSTSINTIQINRNSNQVGQVNLTTSIEEESTNYYYLHKLENTTNNNALYHILKYYEEDLIKLSNLNSTNQLAKNKLEKLEIPQITEELEHLLLQCDKFDTEIKNLYQKINLTNLSIIDIFTK